MNKEKKRKLIFTNEVDKAKYHRRLKERQSSALQYNKDVIVFTTKDMNIYMNPTSKIVVKKRKPLIVWKIKRNKTLERKLRRGNLGTKHTEPHFHYRGLKL